MQAATWATEIPGWQCSPLLVVAPPSQSSPCTRTPTPSNHLSNQPADPPSSLLPGSHLVARPQFNPSLPSNFCAKRILPPFSLIESLQIIDPFCRQLTREPQRRKSGEASSQPWSVWLGVGHSPRNPPGRPAGGLAQQPRIWPVEIEPFARCAFGTSRLGSLRC